MTLTQTMNLSVPIFNQRTRVKELKFVELLHKIKKVWGRNEYFRGGRCLAVELEDVVGLQVKGHEESCVKDPRLFLTLELWVTR